MTDIFNINGLTHRYQDKEVLRVDSLSINKGGILGVAGPNGSGKSTLLKILALLVQPSEGQVRFEGKNVNFNDPASRRDVTLLLQTPYLLKRTVFDNVAYGLKLRGDMDDVNGRVNRALDRVGLSPDSFMHRRWNQLSGGEAQRVALASRLVLRPKVLLLDEPLASVDETSAHLIKRAVRWAVREWDTTLIIVSHDTVWLNDMSDSSLFLYEGRLIGTDQGNLITGPWNRTVDGLHETVLEEGQTIVVSGEKGDSIAALLDPSKITLSLTAPKPEPGANSLSGTIFQMVYEKGPDTVLVEVSLHEITVKARVSADRINELGLRPGLTVWAGFSADDIIWL